MIYQNNELLNFIDKHFTPNLERLEKLNTLTRKNEDNLLSLMKSIKFSTKSNFLISGEAGSGKNLIIDHIAAILDRELYQYNCSRNTIYEELLGFETLKDNSVVAEEGTLLKAIKENAIFVLDELNMADTGVLVKLDSLLDDRRTIFHNEQTYKAQNDFLFFGTMNKGYEGTKELHLGFFSRFLPLEITETPDNIIQDKFPDMDPELGEHISYVYKILNQYVGLKISFREYYKEIMIFLKRIDLFPGEKDNLKDNFNKRIFNSFIMNSSKNKIDLFYSHI